MILGLIMISKKLMGQGSSFQTSNQCQVNVISFQFLCRWPGAKWLCDGGRIGPITDMPWCLTSYFHKAIAGIDCSAFLIR